MRVIGDLFPASFAALEAVIGFIVGATLGRTLWIVAFGLDSSDLILIVVGGLACAVAFAWLGIRLSGRFANRNVEPL